MRNPVKPYVVLVEMVVEAATLYAAQSYAYDSVDCLNEGPITHFHVVGLVHPYYPDNKPIAAVAEMGDTHE